MEQYAPKRSCSPYNQLLYLYTPNPLSPELTASVAPYRHPSSSPAASCSPARPSPDARVPTRMQDTMIASGPRPVATPAPRSAVRETEVMALRQTGAVAYASSVRDSLLSSGTCVMPAPPASPRYSKQRHSRSQSHIQHTPHSHQSTSASVSSTAFTRDSLAYPGSGSDSDSSSPGSDILDSNSGSGSDLGMSCPPTPSMRACLSPPHNNDDVLKGSRQEKRQSAASDDVPDADFKIHPSDIVLGAPLYLPRASLPPLPASPSIPAYSPTTTAFPDADLDQLATLDLQSLDALDNVDNRPDADAIIAMRLARNSLLPHVLMPDSMSSGGPISALTLETGSMRSNSWYGYDSGVGGVPDSSRLPANCDPARESAQTYGSSVLTYGSRASRLFDPETPRVKELSGQDTGMEGEDRPISPYDVPRPSHPLPWNPRPSALARVASAPAAGWRPLPPTPVSKPDVLADMRRSRPLPQTPAGVDSPRSDTSGNEGRSSSASPNIVSLPPIPVEAPLRLSRIRRSTISLIGREDVSGPAVGPGDNILPERCDGGDRDSQKRDRSSISRNVKRTVSVLSRATSMYSVPEIDELLRILDENDTGGAEESKWFDDAPVVNLQLGVSEGRGVGGGDKVLPTPATHVPVRAKVEEDRGIDMEGVLTRPRSSTSASRDVDAYAAVASDKVGSKTGLPTPVATPRTSPDREARPLPRPNSNSLAPTQMVAQPQLLSPMRGQEQELVSPVPSAFSLSRFPLPPTALVIPGPSALGAAEMPIPSTRGAPPSPGAIWARLGTTPAERATLPGMDTYGVKTNVPQGRTPASSPPRPMQSRHVNAPSQLSHTRIRDEIADLKRRILDLPMGVPLLNQPMPPRRRALSVTGGVPQTTKHGRTASNVVLGTRKHAHHTNTRPPAIDVKVANSLPPPSAFGFSVGAPATATSAPAYGSDFQLSAIDPPSGASTILYTTPSVSPLRIRRTASQASAQKVDPAPAPAAAKSGPISLPPPASVPRSAEAAVTTFSAAEAAAKNRSPPSAFSGSGTRTYRSTSLSSGLYSATTPTVEPLRFRNSKLGPRRQGSIVSTTFNKARPTSSVGNDDQRPPANFMTLDTPITEVTGLDDSCPTSRSVWTVETNRSEQDMFGFSNRVSLDPTLVDMMKSIAGASKEERRSSLHTIASSVNTRHGLAPPSSAPFDDGDKSFVDIDEEPAEVKSYRTSTTSEYRKSKRRSTNSVKRRGSSRSAAAVRAAIRALPDPSTFPVPASSGSTSTDGSAAAAAADFTNFMRPSPLPKLRVVTKFKGGAVLVPASQAPLSAVSTKSNASCRSAMSTYSNGVAKPKRVSVLGRRRMNRLTLSDPRSPMTDAAIAAAALVYRVRQKRAALAQYGPSAGAQRRNGIAQGGGMIGHKRTGSIGTLRSKLKMTGGSFFGSGSRVY